MSDIEDYDDNIEEIDDEENDDEEFVNDDDNENDDEEGDDIIMGEMDDEEDDEEEIVNNAYDSDDVDDDVDSQSEDEDDTNYEKFDEEVRKNYVQSVHPELSFRSNDEIDALSIVKRDENTGRIIKDDGHQTIPVLSKYEFTRIIGSRISQLAQGAKPLVALKKKTHDLYLIAEQELIQKKLPFIIMRPIPNGKCEYWKLEDLEIII
jgi:DNA-directed RNA polymerase subunit K/omega